VIRIDFSDAEAMPVSLRALRYVIAAADAASVTAAALRFGVSQSAVSAAIAQVEDQLGLSLFVRHHARGLSPTAPGARVLADARRLLAHAEEFGRTAGALGASAVGDVTLGCFISLAPFVIPRLLSALRASHPAIHLEVLEANQEEILAGVIDGRMELAVTYDYGLGARLAAEPLLDLAPYLIVPEGSRFAGGPAVPLSEVAGEPLVLLDLPLSNDYFLGIFQAAGVEPRIAYRARSYELVRGLVARNFGYSVLNAQPAHPVTYDGGRVAMVPIADALPPLGVVLASSTDVRPRRAVTAVADTVRAALKNLSIIDIGTPA
jgi:DNA-binding transcriptional LysR family regulator